MVDKPMIQFVPATTQYAKLKLLIAGPAGSGKTKTSLLLMRGLVGPTGKIALVDTEGGRASNYAKQEKFDTVWLEDFNPEKFVACIQQAQDAGYDGLIIDSASHEWMGDGGVLSIVDASTQASGNKNQFTSGWSKGTPLHQKFVETVLRCRIHLIVTVRAKMDYILVNNRPEKVGLGPVQRDSFEYEFDVTAMMDGDHNFKITKTSAMFESIDAKIYPKPGKELGEWFAQALSEVEVAAPMPSSSVVKKPALGKAKGSPLMTAQQREQLIALYTERHGDQVVSEADAITGLTAAFKHDFEQTTTLEAGKAIAAAMAEKARALKASKEPAEVPERAS